MAQVLSGKRIAVVATDGFEQSELEAPVKALRDAGAFVDVIAPKGGQITGKRHHEKGTPVKVDHTLAEARPQDYDGLVLPGGVGNADSLRLESKAVQFALHFHQSSKPIAVICHGPWLLVEADAVRG